MTGDYTKVPLRPDERWTGARMQQGRVLLDHEWNLNLDAAARTGADLARDVIGAAGVAAGSPAFEVLAVTAGDLDFGPGHMWVDGMEAYATAPFTYQSQEQIGALPAEGRGLVYLDVFEQHVQPAEDGDLVDPALAPVDSAARTRTGWRARASTTAATTCEAALAALGLRRASDATLTIVRVTPAAPPDPCDPPGDPLGLVPNGLLRVEVLDGGTPGSARFAWSFENGSAAVAVASFAGDEVILGPSASVKFAVGDLVEVSSLVRREDRLDHGPLYEIADVAAGPGGDVLTLDRAVPATLTGASGLVVRRWDGQVVGAPANRVARLGALDLGIRFRAAGTTLLPGDWWGARLRESAADPVELRTNAPPDGITHAFAALALVDFTTRTVLHDCRPTFAPLTELDLGSGTCTVVAFPGDDLQSKVEQLPPAGGELCLAAGTFLQREPLIVRGRRSVVITGVGPATVLRVENSEAALRIEDCVDIEVRHLRVEGGRPRPPGSRHVDGAITAVGCVDVRVVECELFCPDASTRSQACLAIRPGAEADRLPDRIRVEANRFEIGAWQTGVLVVGSATTVVSGNHLRVADPPPVQRTVPTHPLFLRSLGRLMAESFVARTPSARTTKAVAKTAKASKSAKTVATKAGGATKATGRTVKAAAQERLPGIGAARLFAVAKDSVFAPFATRVAAFLTPRRAARLNTPERASHAFAQALAGVRLDDLDPEPRRLIAQLVRGVRPALQGIVVAGDRAETVQILDNVVEGTIQGIHVGTSDAGPGTLLTGQVMIARNVVHAVVPAAYDRDRHAVFVGNARSVHVVDNAATLTRPDGEFSRRRTPVECVRVHGVLGPFLLVRHTSSDRFTVGVRVVPLAPVPSPKARMWLVAETMASGGTKGAILPSAGNPAFPVEGERNVP